MIKPKNSLTIAKKETTTYLNSPATYVVVVVFLVIWEFLFFRQVFLIGEASLRVAFSLLPWLFLVFVPALTMGLIAKEKTEGTLELLLTRPVNEAEVVMGKFLGALSLVAAALAIVFLMGFSLAQFGALDWGVLVGQYLGAVLMAAVLVSLGVFMSSVFRGQIAALLATTALGFVLLLIGSELFSAILPSKFTFLLSQFSLDYHFGRVARGVIATPDLWYFISVSLLFLSLAYLRLLSLKQSPRRLWGLGRVGILFFVGLLTLGNVWSNELPGRVDLTTQKLYTLSPATRRIISSLDDQTKITLYASGGLPAQFQPVLRDTEDLLQDYQTGSQGKIALQVKNPSADPAVAEEAAKLGVRKVQFNVVGRQELQLKSGFLGLVVSHADQNEVIPVIKDTRDLEYQLSSFIKKLTAKKRKKIRFLTGHGEKRLLTDYHLWDKELRKQFEVGELELAGAGKKDKREKGIDQDVDVLVVAGPTRSMDKTARQAIQKYIEGGGAVLFLLDAVDVAPQSLTAAKNENSLADLVASYGVRVNSDLVYDLRANETISFGGNGFGYLISYPFWIRAQLAHQELPGFAKINNLLLPWASSISLDQEKASAAGFSISPLFVTTEAAGRQQEKFDLAPDQQFGHKDLGRQIMAVSLTKKGGARLIVVGDSDFLMDQFLKNTPENLGFGLAALSYLGQSESLGEISLKQRTWPRLIFQSATQKMLLKYGNLILALVLPAGFALVRFRRRRNLARLEYIVTKDKIA